MTSTDMTVLRLRQKSAVLHHVAPLSSELLRLRTGRTSCSSCLYSASLQYHLESVYA